MGSCDAVVDVGHGTTGDESGMPKSGWLYPGGGLESGVNGGVQTPLPQNCMVFELVSNVTVPHWPFRGPPLMQYCPVSVGWLGSSGGMLVFTCTSCPSVLRPHAFCVKGGPPDAGVVPGSIGGFILPGGGPMGGTG